MQKRTQFMQGRFPARGISNRTYSMAQEWAKVLGGGDKGWSKISTYKYANKGHTTFLERGPGAA